MSSITQRRDDRKQFKQATGRPYTKRQLEVVAFHCAVLLLHHAMNLSCAAAGLLQTLRSPHPCQHRQMTRLQHTTAQLLLRWLRNVSQVEFFALESRYLL